jgi:hypothetical protein
MEVQLMPNSGGEIILFAATFCPGWVGVTFLKRGHVTRVKNRHLRH